LLIGEAHAVRTAWTLRNAVLSAAAAVVLAIASIGTAVAQTQLEEAKALYDRVIDLYRAGKFSEAIPLAQRTLELREKALGADHPDVGTTLNSLAVLYQSQGRYAEAELLYKRSLVMAEKALGADHRDVGISLNNLAELYRAQRRHTEAEPLGLLAPAESERNVGHPHEVTRDAGCARRLRPLCGGIADVL
jgi:tetratricopeptide (TPR) repeat protein